MKMKIDENAGPGHSDVLVPVSAEPVLQDLNRRQIQSIRSIEESIAPVTADMRTRIR